jgi:hypothetical protein
VGKQQNKPPPAADPSENGEAAAITAPEITTEAAAEVLQAAAKADCEQCRAEVDEVLQRCGCDIQPVAIISSSGVQVAWNIAKAAPR